MSKIVMFNLADEMTKDLAEVMTNNTARQVLSLLAEEELTATDLSKKLSLPINSVTYNLDKLKKVELIEEAGFFYSEKGKKMPRYKVVNKYILISPRETKGMKSKLSSLLPIGVLFVTSAFVLIAQKFLQGQVRVTQRTVEVAMFAEESALAIDLAVPTAPIPPLAWFVLGGLLVWIIYRIVEYVRLRRTK